MCFSYEDVVEKDDISRTVKEVVEEVNIFKYIDFSQNNAHGYDAIQMFEAVILAFAINGYASLRDLEKLCKYDIRFKFIMNGSTPSHMAFERLIKDKLTMPIEDIFVDINKYIEAHDVIDTEVLYIDGTKFEANANKMTFVWMKDKNPKANSSKEGANSKSKRREGLSYGELINILMQSQ